MINSNKDLYECIARIQDSLKSEGYTDLSISLDEALSASTVPGEIFGELKLLLKESRAGEVCKKLGLKDDIDEVLRYIAKA